MISLRSFHPATPAGPVQGGHPDRILMTADTVGGVWGFAMDLCRGWLSEGTRVMLATMGNPLRPDQWEEVHALPGLQVEESRYRLEWMEDPWEDVDQAGAWLLDLARQWQPDLIHLNSYAHACLPWRAPVLMTAHSCVLSWWQAVHRQPAPRAWNKYEERVREGWQSADMVTAPTAALAETMLNIYGIPRRLKVIPNGRDPAGFHGEPFRAPVIAGAGRLWDEAKNLRSLAEAADGLQWPVVVAGDCQEPSKGGPSVFPNVSLKGHLPQRDLRRLLSKAAIFAHPAWYEPFGLAVLEAALSGCALVLGDIPSLREVWGGNALYVDPGNPAALAKVLDELIRDPELRSQMAGLARRRGSQYTAARMFRNYQNTATQLLEDWSRQGIATSA